MAYTNAWSSAAPLGSVPASTVDEEIRKARLDLEERLLDKVFNTPFTADPLVVRPEILGNKTGKTLYIGFAEFAFQNDVAGTINFGNDSNWNGLANTAYAPFILPVGCTITRMKLLADRNGNNIKWKGLYVPFTLTPTAVDIFAERTLNAGGLQIDDSGALTEVVATLRMYYVRVDPVAATSPKIYGVEITYDTPDCRNTL